MNADEQAIAEVLKRYGEAANRADAAAVAELYTRDAVLMAQNSRSGTNTARNES